MKLFLISQDENGGYDTYDSAVVAAEDEEAARKIHPTWDGEIYYVWNEELQHWANKATPDKPSWRWYGFGTADWTAPKNVNVKYLGEAAEGIETGCICSSFNAG
jgi:arylsulfatase A-like enzyme